MVLDSASGPIQACSGFGLKEEVTCWHQVFGLSGPPACPSPAWSGSASGSLPTGQVVWTRGQGAALKSSVCLSLCTLFQPLCYFIYSSISQLTKSLWEERMGCHPQLSFVPVLRQCPIAGALLLSRSILLSGESC